MPPHLQKLVLYSCKELRLHLNEKEASETGRGLQGLHSLQHLSIFDCPEFFSTYSSHSSSCFPFPTSLQTLSLHLVDMEIPVPLSNLIYLTELRINGCGRGLRVQGLWPLLTQGHLAKLQVFETPNFFVDSEPSWSHEHQILPCSSKLQYIGTDDTAGLLASPICGLISLSLTTLVLQDNKVELFSKKQEEALQLLTTLQALKFQSCRKLQCLAACLHILADLKTLEISSCPAIRSCQRTASQVHCRNCISVAARPSNRCQRIASQVHCENCISAAARPSGRCQRWNTSQVHCD